MQNTGKSRAQTGAGRERGSCIPVGLHSCADACNLLIISAARVANSSLIGYIEWKGDSFRVFLVKLLSSLARPSRG